MDWFATPGMEFLLALSEATKNGLEILEAQTTREYSKLLTFIAQKVVGSFCSHCAVLHQSLS